MKRALHGVAGLWALFVVLLAGALGAQEPPVAEAPEPGSELEVYLVTAWPGDSIWEKFSHNALWIRDTRTGRDVAYNWGIFSFSQESFIKRLIQGRMLYAMHGMDMGEMVRSYEDANRTIRVHRVNLSPAQALELQAAAHAMDNDEDRWYTYNYYLDNCSTRVRDALDAVLGGQLSDQWADQPTGRSFRWHTRRLLQVEPWAYYGIQFVLGNPGDDEIGVWEEMFLPLRLLDFLERTEVTLADGTRGPLLGPAETLYTSRGRKPVPTEPPASFFWISFGVGVVVAAGVAALAGISRGGRALSARGFGMIGVVLSVLFGLLGTGLALAWIFTDHTFWRWNENLFWMNPLSLVLGAVLLVAALRGSWSAAARWSRIVGIVSVAGLVLHVLLPPLAQRSGDILVLVIPAQLALAWGTRRLARRDPGALGA